MPAMNMSCDMKRFTQRLMCMYERMLHKDLYVYVCLTCFQKLSVIQNDMQKHT